MDHVPCRDMMHVHISESVILGRCHQLCQAEQVVQCEVAVSCGLAFVDWGCEACSNTTAPDAEVRLCIASQAVHQHRSHGARRRENPTPQPSRRLTVVQLHEGWPNRIRTESTSLGQFEMFLICWLQGPSTPVFCTCRASCSHCV